MEITFYPIIKVRPNPWNPNKMNAREFEAEIESILHFGFVDPVTVRENNGPEVIDGAHRVRAMAEICRRYRLPTIDPFSVKPVENAAFEPELGWRHKDGSHLKSNEFIPTLEEMLKREEIPCVNLGSVPTSQAKKLTIILNETRGKAEKQKLSSLLANIAEEAKMSIGQLQIGLPYRERELTDFLELRKLDWSKLENIGASIFRQDQPEPSTRQGQHEPRKTQEVRTKDKIREAESRLIDCPSCGHTFSAKKKRRRR
jgi:ParB-like chromosome segregation protein Spo0J